MGFKLNSISKTFPGLVTADVVGETGKTQKIAFHVHYNRLSTTEFDALVKRTQQRNEQGERDYTDDECLAEVLGGFGDDLLDEDGSPLEFTPENLAALCDVYPLKQRMVQGFFDNFVKAKAKN